MSNTRHTVAVPETAVEEHYTAGELLERILAALGRDLETLQPIDLAPVDAFHTRGRESTVELARLAEVQPGLEVLDVGCGLGGSVRYLAAEHGCEVTGVDLTAEYIEVAAELARLVGLGERVRFVAASALDLPFEDGSFDLVWTEHAQMNIPDKAGFYSEIRRVLRPGGRLAFHDVFAGGGDDVHFPVPWASSAQISALVDAETAQGVISSRGLDLVEWRDLSEKSLQWFRATVARLAELRESGGVPPPLGLHLLMGGDAPAKLGNLARNLEEGRVRTVQGIAVAS